ncbi:hypothetical protein M426DRAFT_251883 [Hypoxylon sp. CI-4A]|nr:hypothetical protein M426DRAFT_251883 [Hypoxylon sp. CI-4A]
MMLHEDLAYAGRRLQLVGSRVVVEEETESGSGHRVLPAQPQHHHHHHHHEETEEGSPEKRPDAPKFYKTETATNFELFYDLWFVANLNVFASIHHITDIEAFNSFIGYMVMLWTTWLLTSLYDVRFTADSVWERCCKAVHLGVMVGFAEIGTNFDPDNQIVSIFRAMSLFLAVSRFILFLQYGMVAFQIRQYSDGKRAMWTTAILHFIAAAIYFGVSFRYNLGKSSRVFLVWYIGGLVEMALHLSFSQLSHVLTFLGTHLGERLNLLTLVILGEGCIILARSITLLVQDTFLKDAAFKIWSPTLIGLVTAGTALIYIIFQLYFDWMHEEDSMSMSKRYQVWWTSLHLPFHVALVLLLEGVGQFILWARIVEDTTSAIRKVASATAGFDDDVTSEEVSETLGNVVRSFLTEYPPAEIIETMESVNETLEHIAEIPNSFWDSDPSSDDSTLLHYQSDVAELMNTMINAVYTFFGTEPAEEVEGNQESEYYQSEAAVAAARKFILVYIYAFACAGIVMLFLIVMHIISKRRGWSPFNIFRTGISIGISITLALLACVAANQDRVLDRAHGTSFVGSSWMLPTITIAYFIVLVSTHLPHPTSFGLGHFGRGTYNEVDLESGKDSKDNRASAGTPRRNHHVADHEDRRTGYSSPENEMVSPPLPRYDDNRTGSHHHHHRSRRSYERRRRNTGPQDRRRRQPSRDY